MSAAAALRDVPEMVPIQHESADRVVRVMVFAVPPAALVVGGWLAWGGAVRVFLLHHATFSINSLCHYFGSRPFSTGDQSRKPRVARTDRVRRGMAQQPPRVPDLRSARPGRRQLDPGAWHSALERSRLAWDVVRISPERQQAKRGSAA